MGKKVLIVDAQTDQVLLVCYLKPKDLDSIIEMAKERSQCK